MFDVVEYSRFWSTFYVMYINVFSLMSLNFLEVLWWYTELFKMNGCVST